MSDVTEPPRLSRRSQGLAPLEQVVRYHEETKHQFMRYARSLGFLDWANQPDPFRRYVGAGLIPLPLPSPSTEDGPRYDELYRLGAVPTIPVTVDSVSRFFEYALSVTAWKQAGDVRWALRSNPSSGNLHPTEGYVIARAIAGLSEQAGIYHYAPKEHGLELRLSVSETVIESLLRPFPPQAMLVGVTSVQWREAWKYGERAFRYCQHDVGHALGSLRLAAAALGWRMLLLDAISTEQCAGLLGLDRVQDFEGSEHEQADCLAAMWPEPEPAHAVEFAVPTGVEPSTIDRIKALAWSGRANRLSPDVPLVWDIIDEVTAATVHPSRPIVRRQVRPALPGRDETPPRTVSAHSIFHQRRSAVSFDGATSVTAEQFFAMLRRVLPSPVDDDSMPVPPWDLWAGPARVHFAIFVHLVTGLEPGLYCLVRDRSKVAALRAAMNPAFSWVEPPAAPDGFPLYALAEGDARRLAAQLCCHQDIAGASAFSVGMLAEFEEPLQEEGPSLYPRLFWECGLIGQVLYLEAEAAGVRATGIGCYFDDPVHEVLGLKGRTFQSLYHFTVGGPVEDQRLTTLPPYPNRNG